MVNFSISFSLSLFLLPLKKIVKENGCLKIDLKDQKKSNFAKLKGTKETRKSNAKALNQKWKKNFTETG